MSGYAGNPDLEAEHAAVLCENGIRAAQSLLDGPVLDQCMDCGESITPARVELMRKINMKCMYCITCQPHHDRARRVKMLDRIL